jgi:hypothetical protein
VRKSIVGISPRAAKKRYGNACETAYFALGFRLNIPTLRFVAVCTGAVAALVPSLGHAQVYKCAGVGGIPSTRRCPAVRQGIAQLPDRSAGDHDLPARPRPGTPLRT